MSENPYAPPKAEVSDVDSADDLLTRPAQIVLAVRLGIAQLVLGWLTMAISWDYYARLQAMSTTLGSQLLGAALVLWLWYKIHQGRNWARIVLICFLGLGVLGLLVPGAVQILLAAPTIPKVSGLISTVISFVVMWLLFISPGRHWFKKGAKRVAALSSAT